MKLAKTVFLILVTGVVTLEAQVRETPAIIALEQGGNPQGYIQGSKPGAILFSPTQGVRGIEYSFSQIKGTGIDELIRLEARSEVLANPLAEFSTGNYLEAAKGFAQVVNNYQIVLHIPQNFASEAMFYQIESFRRMGNFKAMAPLIASPAGKSINTMLSDRYKQAARLHKVWAVYGSGDMDALAKELESFQEPVTGKAKLLPAPNFRKMPQNELVQVSFLRGELYKSRGEQEKALEDYSRVFSLTFAHDDFLSKQAMGSALVIQSQNPALKSDKEKIRNPALHQMQSVAYFFSKRFPNTPMPDQFKEYAVRPQINIEVAPEGGEKEAGGEGDPAKPGEGMPGGKGKADDKGKAAPAKGKADPAKGKAAPAKAATAKGKAKNAKK